MVKFAMLHEEFAVLRFGTGTGVVAVAAKTAVGPTGMVVGVDSALIRLSRERTACLTVASVPSLPFRNETFDAVLAGFVVSHFERYVDGLGEMVRVCRVGGRHECVGRVGESRS